MTKSSNPFLLPKCQPPASGDDSFTVKSFESWVEGLPTGNVGQTAKELYVKLKEMNRTEIPPTDRMRLLGLLDQPLQFVLQTLAENYLHEPPPLSKRNKSAAELVFALCILVIQAYKMALNQFHHESLAGRVFHKSGRAEAIHKVIYFLGQMLLRSFQLYQPAPKWLWHEIHGLYIYAVDHHLHEKLLENEDPRSGGLQTAASLYKQILLLSLSGPYRMLQGEVGRVYMALQRWAPKSNLVELGRADTDAALFVVDGKADEAPRYRGLGDDQQIEKGWVLDTRGLSEYLAEELEGIKATSRAVGSNRPMGAKDAVSAELLDRLMLTWGIGVKRATDRTESSGDVLLYSGLDSLYSMLGGGMVSDAMDGFYGMESLAQDEKGKQDEPETYHPEFDEHVVEGAGHLSSLDDGSAAAELSKPVEIIDSSDQTETEEARDCWIIDESESGFHLGWYGSGRTSVHVGELVGVQKRISGLLGDLHIGVIRWLMSEGGETVDFGVELFQGDTAPVVVNRERGNGDLEVFPGLLHNSPAGTQSLLTAPFFADEDDKITLIQGSQQNRVRLSKVLDGSAAFVQVSFKARGKKKPVVAEEQPVADEPAAQQPVKELVSGDEFDFDELWDQL